MKKILIIRFSSIGDIVLTTPVIRCLKKQLKNSEIHYLTKKQFVPVLKQNPYIDKIISLEKKLSALIPELKKENYDFIVDLHKNIRTKYVIFKLRKPYSAFNKLNIKKWILVNFKINLLPKIHIVDRYFKTVKKLNVKNDNAGLDYFIPENDEINLSTLSSKLNDGYIAFVIGGNHFTKLFPSQKIINICNKINKPAIILGGKEDKQRGDYIKKQTGNNVINVCGLYNINQSASIIKQADIVITNDTGLMHIAAAFNKKIISVWGNTVPEFGMYPYLTNENKSIIFETKGLKCRPCTKIGFKKCPKKHFNCMNNINENEIIQIINKHF
ncbi:MAG: glycosyltransferase family 9 protein [Bacteroidales bacterium]|nr:glycosyltransferase family 9 protein [Bacteroidales bacterium]